MDKHIRSTRSHQLIFEQIRPGKIPVTTIHQYHRLPHSPNPEHFKIRAQNAYYKVIKDHTYYDFNRQDTRNGYTLLHYVARGCLFEAKHVHPLIISGANIDATDFMGNTPLKLAARSECASKEMIIELLNHGADPNIADLEGFTPLMVALPRPTEFDKEAIVDLLLCADADVTVATPMMDDKIQKKLINLGRKKIISWNITALHIECFQKHGTLSVIRNLVYNGANVNALNNYNQEPFYVTIVYSNLNLKIMSFLIECGSNINNYDSHYNMTPLGYLIKYSENNEHTIPAIQLLVDHKADLYKLCDKTHTSYQYAKKIYKDKKYKYHHECNTKCKSNCKYKRDYIRKYKGNTKNQEVIHNLQNILQIIETGMIKNTAKMKVVTYATSETCIVCLENSPNIKLYPCGHANLCNICAIKPDTCPECRVPIVDRISIDCTSDELSESSDDFYSSVSTSDDKKCQLL